MTFWIRTLLQTVMGEKLEMLRVGQNFASDGCVQQRSRDGVRVRLGDGSSKCKSRGEKEQRVLIKKENKV